MTPPQIGTSSTLAGYIDLGISATIDGDILVGPGGDPDTVIDYGTSPTISGDTLAMTEPWDPPSVTVPEELLSAPNKGVITASTTITTSGKYNSIKLVDNGVITIDGDVTLYITQDIMVGNSFEFHIVPEAVNPNASLTLYLGGNLIAFNSCTFNNETEDPQKLRIFALPSCETIDINNSVTIHGTVYAPDTDVRFQNSVEIFGALISKSSDFVNSVLIHYDARLRDLSADPDICSKMEIVRDVNSFLEL